MERGARHAQEFASLPLKSRETMLKGLAKRTTPLNILPHLFASEYALEKLGVVIDQDMVLDASRKLVSMAMSGWNLWKLMVWDWRTAERYQSMAAVYYQEYAARLNQALLSSILLCPHLPLFLAISHESASKLNKRYLNSVDGLENDGWIFVKNVDLIL